MKEQRRRTQARYKIDVECEFLIGAARVALSRCIPAVSPVLVFGRGEGEKQDGFRRRPTDADPWFYLFPSLLFMNEVENVRVYTRSGQVPMRKTHNDANSRRWKRRWIPLEILGMWRSGGFSTEENVKPVCSDYIYTLTSDPGHIISQTSSKRHLTLKLHAMDTENIVITRGANYHFKHNRRLVATCMSISSLKTHANAKLTGHDSIAALGLFFHLRIRWFRNWRSIGHACIYPTVR